jgi:hypothetical protein
MFYRLYVCLCVNDWVIMRIIEVCTAHYLLLNTHYVCLYINVRIRCKINNMFVRMYGDFAARVCLNA